MEKLLYCFFFFELRIKWRKTINYSVIQDLFHFYLIKYEVALTVINNIANL